MSDKYLITSIAVPKSLADLRLAPVNAALASDTAQFVKLGERWGYLPDGPEGEDWGVVVALASVLGHGRSDILDWLAPIARDFDGVHFECVLIR